MKTPAILPPLGALQGRLVGLSKHLACDDAVMACGDVQYVIRCYREKSGQLDSYPPSVQEVYEFAVGGWMHARLACLVCVVSVCHAIAYFFVASFARVCLQCQAFVWDHFC